MRHIVTFSANLCVEVEADTEEEARDKATEIANIQAARFDTVVQEIDWIVIHTDDIVRVEKLEEGTDA